MVLGLGCVVVDVLNTPTLSTKHKTFLCISSYFFEKKDFSVIHPTLPWAMQ